MSAAADPLDWRDRLLRAILFVPGNDQRKLEKAGSAGADLVVVDLEDAVAEQAKTEARSTARQAVGVEEDSLDSVDQPDAHADADTDHEPGEQCAAGGARIEIWAAGAGELGQRIVGGG